MMCLASRTNDRSQDRQGWETMRQGCYLSSIIKTTKGKTEVFFFVCWGRGWESTTEVSCCTVHGPINKVIFYSHYTLNGGRFHFQQTSCGLVLLKLDCHNHLGRFQFLLVTPANALVGNVDGLFPCPTMFLPEIGVAPQTLLFLKENQSFLS